MKTLLLMLIIVLSFAQMSCSKEQKQEVAQNSEIKEVAVASQSEALESPKMMVTEPSCQLKVGFDVWEPYQYEDVDGKVRGLDIEIVSAVSKKINCEIEFVQGAWVRLLEDLRNGDVDMLLGASKTPAREEYALFSIPYRTEEFALYIRKDDPTRAAYKDVNQFIENGSKIGVVSDYYYGQNVSTLLDNEETAKYFVFGIMGELNIARLLDMDIDGFLEDSYVGASMIRRKALGDYIYAHGFTVETGDIYVMFSRDSVDESTVANFNSAMESFKSGTLYQEIVTKYGR